MRERTASLFVLFAVQKRHALSVLSEPVMRRAELSCSNKAPSAKLKSVLLPVGCKWVQGRRWWRGYLLPSVPGQSAARSPEKQLSRTQWKGYREST